jgi:8-oxo-dGTP diphosphatase
MLYLSLELNSHHRDGGGTTTTLLSSDASSPHVTTSSKSSSIAGYDRTWHGGHPADDRSGSCWCGSADRHCLCTPNLAIDLIITTTTTTTTTSMAARITGAVGRDEAAEAAAASSTADHIWLVRRRDTDQLATMGGFVDVDESVEHAVRRELGEEMGIEWAIPPTLVGVYSDPRRDNRRRTVSVVFAIHIPADLQPQPGDDAKEVVKIPIDEIENHTYFADHRTILLDYRATLTGAAPISSTEKDFATDIVRSICSTS